MPASIGAAFEPDGGDPVEIVGPVHAFVIQPNDAQAQGFSAARLAESKLRPAAALFDRLRRLDPAPLTVERPPARRVVGTCRHFAVMACAMLRHRAVATRVRCGFATYFQPGQALDHWIVEYWDQARQIWVRLDPEVLGGTVVDDPLNLRPDQFISGTEAWAAYRRGDIDAGTFGVYGTANFGPAEIRGNAVKDLAALNKVEMLPWDEWGQMTSAYEGKTGPDYDELLDTIAAAAATDDQRTLAELYQHPDLCVPGSMLT